MASINRMTDDGKVKLVKDITEKAENVYHIRIQNHGTSYMQEVIIRCVNLEAAEKLFDLLSNESDYLI